MRCPYCNYPDSKVVDSRGADNASSIRRRRECLKCHRRFTTFERYEVMNLLVNKKDGRRESFEQRKLLTGLLKAFEKRPVSYEAIEQMAEDIERELRGLSETGEVTSKQIGELVMKHLARVDQVAYVRFASVYRQFADVQNFVQEIQQMLCVAENKKK